MSNRIQEIEDFIANDPKALMKIYAKGDRSKKSPINKPNVKENPAEPSNIYYKDFLTTNKSFKQYLDDLIAVHGQPIYIQARKKNGNTTTPSSIPVIEYSLGNQDSAPKQQPSNNMNHNQQPPQQFQQPVQQQPQMMDFQFGGMNAGMSAMVSEMADLKAKAQRSDDYLRDMNDLRKELYEERTKNLNLTAEKNDLTVFKNNAEREKELAIALLKSENKSFMESEGFKTMMEQLPGLLPLLAGNGGQIPEYAQGQGNPNPRLSEVKQQFIATISIPQVSDGLVELLQEIAQRLNIEEYLTELYALNDKYPNQQ
ncbi:hypothetical protein [Nonlabens agnitus]|uniref:Uncharacterized protein n=1 Tax=Nonlabens agnitus TaxID=870484 RepID=A0A2S9WXA7_9FLAO|nr:hypothetical protein [Nonlabens agnitus]PRP68104.1 hypothetical protein BST86_13915 [Nonlabens agnitus]